MKTSWFSWFHCNLCHTRLVVFSTRIFSKMHFQDLGQASKNVKMQLNSKFTWRKFRMLATPSRKVDSVETEENYRANSFHLSNKQLLNAYSDCTTYMNIKNKAAKLQKKWMDDHRASWAHRELYETSYPPARFALSLKNEKTSLNTTNSNCN